MPDFQRPISPLERLAEHQALLNNMMSQTADDEKRLRLAQQSALIQSAMDQWLTPEEKTPWYLDIPRQSSWWNYNDLGGKAHGGLVQMKECNCHG